jgi:hypothetical protein
MMEALSSSETSVLTRATRRNILEDGILHSHRRENLKSYTSHNWLIYTCALAMAFFVEVPEGKKTEICETVIYMRYSS